MCRGVLLRSFSSDGNKVMNLVELLRTERLRTRGEVYHSRLIPLLQLFAKSLFCAPLLQVTRTVAELD